LTVNANDLSASLDLEKLDFSERRRTDPYAEIANS
jgi:hypothetical protein